jgi:hypothetical protein
VRKPASIDLESASEATHLEDPQPIVPRTQLDTLVRLLSMAERDEVTELFAELGPEAARHLGRELRNANPQSAQQRDLYRRALMALICADLAHEFTPLDSPTG